jgi:acyl carrier protein
VTDAELDQAVRSVLSQIAPEADLDALGQDVDIHDELDLDSMDFLNFVIGLEAATGIDVPEREYARLRTLAGCVDYLHSRTAPH